MPGVPEFYFALARKKKKKNRKMHLMARFKIQFLFIKSCVLQGATFRNNDANNLIFFSLVLLFFSESEYVKKFAFLDDYHFRDWRGGKVF